MGQSAVDEKWMLAALGQAREGLRSGELPIGAVVVSGGEIVGRAHTLERAERRFLVHAELLALDEADRRSGWDRRSSTLYTTLEPCLMCLGAAATTMVGRVVFALPSTSDGAARLAQEWELARSDDLLHVKLPIITGGVGRADAEALFAEFVEQRADDDPFARWVKTLL